jgi:Ser/Thr protein kinase RdoA (MazF antagonist)
MESTSQQFAMIRDRQTASSLVHAAEQFLGTDVRPSGWLDGGDEATVLRVDTGAGPVVLHVSPSWRTRDELEWVHSVAQHAHRRVLEAITPIECRGETAFEWQGRFVAAFPFVSGDMLDRDDAALRADAARLLAAIHVALSDFRGGGRPHDAVRAAPFADPTGLRDLALDAWWASVAPGLTTGPTHGDYYRRNLLCAGGQIVGVIDWHDANVRSIAVELAGATFELCRSDEHVFQFHRADDFVALYRSSKGPVPIDEIALLLKLIRVWIRDDVRSALASGGTVSDEYVVKQMQAFQELSSSDWVPLGCDRFGGRGQ